MSCHVTSVRTKDVVPIGETVWPYSAFYVDKVVIKLTIVLPYFLRTSNWWCDASWVVKAWVLENRHSIHPACVILLWCHVCLESYWKLPPKLVAMKCTVSLVWQHFWAGSAFTPVLSGLGGAVALAIIFLLSEISISWGPSWWFGLWDAAVFLWATNPGRCDSDLPVSVRGPITPWVGHVSLSVLCNSTLQDHTNVGKIASISRASQVQAPVSISQWCNESQKVKKSPKPRLSGPRLHMDIHHTILMLMDMDRRWAADGLRMGCNRVMFDEGIHREMWVYSDENNPSISWCFSWCLKTVDMKRPCSRPSDQAV